MKSWLGIYFGSKVINILETNGRDILNNIQIPKAEFSGGELEEKVPDEVKIVALCKDRLRKGRIEAKDAVLTLSGKDLIIRTFELPLLPAEELNNAVIFEAKKYIPFKVEDLISTYQSKIDKVNRKVLILFVGVKKETLAKYMSILDQLALKVTMIEYSVFSILRFLQLTEFGKAGNKGVIGVMSMDFREESEVNFVVLENGFPLFSRDITLLSGADELEAGPAVDAATIMDKLKTEIRISLDYYDRKFPARNIEKTFILVADEHRQDLDNLFKDIGLSVKFIESGRYIGKAGAFSLNLIKGYGCALFKKVQIIPKIDLLSVKSRIKPAKEEEPAGAKPSLAFLAGLKIDPRVVIVSVLICLGVYGFGYTRLQPLKKGLAELQASRPVLNGVDPSATTDALASISRQYRDKIIAVNSLIRKQLYLTKQLQAIADLVPEGVWLNNFSFKTSSGRVEVNLNGGAYLGNADKEFNLINEFLSQLKVSDAFSKHFSEISIVSIDRSEDAGTAVTNFSIRCQGLVSAK